MEKKLVQLTEPDLLLLQSQIDRHDRDVVTAEEELNQRAETDEAEIASLESILGDKTYTEGE